MSDRFRRDSSHRPAVPQGAHPAEPEQNLSEQHHGVLVHGEGSEGKCLVLELPPGSRTVGKVLLLWVCGGAEKPFCAWMGRRQVPGGLAFTQARIFY